MIWMILMVGFEDGASEYSASLQALDGDLDKVELVDKSIDIGKWGIDKVEQFRSGRHVDPTFLPSRLVIAYDHSPQPADGEVVLSDYLQFAWTQVVPARFRYLVEQMDPGVHQFVPVTLEWASGNAVSAEYYYLIPGTRLFPLDFEQSKPEMRIYPEGPDWINPHKDRPAAHFSARGPYKSWDPAFRSEVIAGHDLFCAGDFPGKIFVSDRLKSAIEGAGFTGLRFRGPYRQI